MDSSPYPVWPARLRIQLEIRRTVGDQVGAATTSLKDRFVDDTGNRLAQSSGGNP
jgi:hypothetical protein